MMDSLDMEEYLSITGSPGVESMTQNTTLSLWACNLQRQRLQLSTIEEESTSLLAVYLISY